MSVPTNIRRVVHREIRSSRSVPAIIAALILLLVVLWVGTELVLSVFGQPALVVAPTQMLQQISGLPGSVQPVWLAAAGAVLIIIGLILVVLAVKPGHRGRHIVNDDRLGVVVDDRAIASALSAAARRAASLAPDQAVTTVSRRKVRVLLHPTSGSAVDEADVTAAVQEQLDQMNLRPEPRLRIEISPRGVIGA
ncbi:DUF6286 domain-containing protein [Tersicoccus sp. Bi-70]|uniref:DUF6286 domain-containing protein n=1 Tax=Tersicoccus sp. Bi-70 TaxID=1897634 RepID=UPI0009759468|nr:DUF6286 domain-containing protein [Tersicoccus sp. Bi-70]OMH34080.1 hypothetical protein BGP79_02620 [Tersicoccus sp. Bi-70]